METTADLGRKYLQGMGLADDAASMATSDLSYPYTKEHPHCDGSWHVWHDAKGLVWTQRCNCEGLDSWGRLLARTAERLGGNYTWDRFDWRLQPQLKTVAEALRTKWHTGVYLEGPRGTGKTHLVTALVYEAIKQHLKADLIHCIVLSDLFSQSQGFGDGREDAREKIEKLCHQDVLVLDDLGAQRHDKSGVFREQLQLLLDTFKGTLLLTTNLSDADMFERIQGPNISRLAGRCVRWKTQGQDQRGRR
jgi:DNA replication protein DnaC